MGRELKPCAPLLQATLLMPGSSEQRDEHSALVYGTIYSAVDAHSANSESLLLLLLLLHHRCHPIVTSAIAGVLICKL